MKMKNVLKKLLGGGVALALSMAMALGIFAGTGMDAKAEDVEYEIVPIEKQDDFANLVRMCEFIGGDRNEQARRDYIDTVYPSLEASTGGIPYVVIECSNPDNPNPGICLRYRTNSGNMTNTATGERAYNSIYKNETNYWFLLRKKVASPSDTSNSASSPVSTSHTHSYSWVTVQEANAGQDGIEEYRCSCGDVQGRSIIPASVVAVKGLFGEIKNAPQNGTATFDSGRLYTISDYVIKKLAERTDVTTVIAFEYQNQAYKLTIPAGADFTSLLADEEYFYGYFFFANAVGATIEAI